MALEIEYTKKRHTLRWVILIIIVLLLVAAGWFGYRWYTTGQLPPIPLPIADADSGVDESAVSSLQISQYTVSALSPRYIRIPSLGIGDTRIYPVGLDSGDLLAYPTNIHDVGWYQKSSTPGSGGVVLLNTHTKGASSNNPLIGLAGLKAGTQIVIERGDGQVFTYTVVENQNFTVDQLYTAGLTVMSQPIQTGQESLNIVADSGSFIPQLGMFNDRDLLRATLVNPTN